MSPLSVSFKLGGFGAIVHILIRPLFTPSSNRLMNPVPFRILRVRRGLFTWFTAIEFPDSNSVIWLSMAAAGHNRCILVSMSSPQLRANYSVWKTSSLYLVDQYHVNQVRKWYELQGWGPYLLFRSLPSIFLKHKIKI